MLTHTHIWLRKEGLVSLTVVCGTVHFGRHSTSSSPFSLDLASKCLSPTLSPYIYIYFLATTSSTFKPSLTIQKSHCICIKRDMLVEKQGKLNHLNERYNQIWTSMVKLNHMDIKFIQFHHLSTIFVYISVLGIRFLKQGHIGVSLLRISRWMGIFEMNGQKAPTTQTPKSFRWARNRRPRRRDTRR